jgi:isopenicillin N synthase-like dioxygenase
MRKVPELSLLSFVQGTSADRQKFVDNLFVGLKEYGFIILEDHLVDKKIIDKSYELITQFFNLPENKKLEYVSPMGGGQRGYTPFGKEHAKNNPMPDLKEFWHVGREVEANHRFSKYYPNNIWPEDSVPGFKETLTTLYNQLDLTSYALMEALSLALDVPKSYFADMLNLGNSILRPLHYPPLAPNTPEGAVRSAAHEDINLITILVGATTSGLELLDRDGSWLAVENKEGQLVVDSGDMLSRISNEVIPSTTHRVVNPQGAKNTSRYSMPFFVHPNPDTVLECIPSCIGKGAKYPPINAHDFLLQRLEEIGLMKGDRK